MEIIKQLRIDLTHEDVQKIVADHISDKMLNIGYKLRYVDTGDDCFPAVSCHGVLSKEAKNK